ncbi:MAG: hypothetical protein AAFV98_08850 [Chloroflexota bacterium]
MTKPVFSIELEITWRAYDLRPSKTHARYAIKGYEQAIADVQKLVALHHETESQTFLVGIDCHFQLDGKPWDTLGCWIEEFSWYTIPIKPLVEERNGTENFLLEQPEVHLDWNDDDLMVAFIDPQTSRRGAMVAREQFIQQLHEVWSGLAQWAEAVQTEIETIYFEGSEIKRIQTVKHTYFEPRQGTDWDDYLAKLTPQMKRMALLWAKVNHLRYSSYLGESLMLMQKFLNNKI